MLRKIFISLCNLFGRKDKLSSVELIAMITTVFLVTVAHLLFLIFIFNFEMTFLVEDYGKVMLAISFTAFTFLYFWLVKKFKEYAKSSL